MNKETIAAITKTFVIAHTDDTDEHLAQSLVYNAGRLAWRMREMGVEVDQKTSISDVVTTADRAAELFIAGVLEALRPNDGILGEENTQRTGDSGRTWVIDPVDGTYNFVHGSDYWCSALALVEGDPADPDVVRFGAVHRPAMGYTWFGGTEIPTTRDGKALSLGSDHSPQETCLGSYLHPTDFPQEAIAGPWLNVAQRFATVRMLGSASIDLAGVSGGEMGCWMQRSVAPWDWLPGRALVEGVGGVARQVMVNDTVWSVAGTPGCVEEVTEALLGSNFSPED